MGGYLASGSALTNSQESRDASKAQAIWTLGAKERAADVLLSKLLPKRSACSLSKKLHKIIINNKLASLRIVYLILNHVEIVKLSS